MNRKEFALIAVIIFLTVVAWIGFGIYHARTHADIKGIKKLDTSPLTSNFDSDIITLLKNKEGIE